jgi:hypothetical protein
MHAGWRHGPFARAVRSRSPFHPFGRAGGGSSGSTLVLLANSQQTEVLHPMTLRRYGVALFILLALLATAMFVAGQGAKGSARADSSTPAQTQKVQKDSSTSSNGSSNDWSGSNSSGEGSIGTTGSGTSDGSSVLSGVGDTQNVNPSNRLSSARVIRQNVNDGQEEYARYCFKDGIQTLDKSKADQFAVIGPNPGDGKTASDVRLDESRSHCVLVGFASGSDLKSYTIAAVEGGVVKNRDGQKNIADTMALGNTHDTSSHNRVAGPDLVKVRLSKDLNQAQFTFDENIQKGSGDAGSFGFYSKAGGYHTASEVVSTFNRTVTVKFDSNDQVDTSQRWFVKGGAVQDDNGTDNVLGTTDGSTDAPDLTSVSRDASDTMYDYKFDENVGDLQASDFVLYTNSGTEIQADSINIDGDQVHATFSQDIQDYPKDIVLAGVDPSNASDNTDNGTSTASDNGTLPTIGVDGIGSTNVARDGRTTGPNLISVSKNADNERLTLRFNEKLDDNSDQTDASGIYLVTSDNRLLQADRTLSVDGKKLYVKANKTDIKALKGVVIEGGAVTDKQGNTNALTTDIWGSGDTISGSSSHLFSHSDGAAS